MKRTGCLIISTIIWALRKQQVIFLAVYNEFGVCNRKKIYVSYENVLTRYTKIKNISDKYMIEIDNFEEKGHI